MNVVTREQDCEFAFDFSKVYWNTRLGTEHSRIVGKFKEGEAVCDVMAGVGPFAIPAGRKKKAFVWANDLNPHAYEQMADAIRRNKVQEFVKAFKMDGRDFIKYATNALYESEEVTATIPTKSSCYNTSQKQQQGACLSPYGKIRTHPPPKVLTCPRTFDHYVMNLPVVAISFLDAFIGIYAGRESLFYPHTTRRLPMIHVYCFSTNSEDERNEHVDICQRISDQLGFTISPEDHEGGSGDRERDLEIHGVRLVSPNKKMFCASFRIPQDVAFKQV